jgi:hypothetical protein
MTGAYVRVKRGDKFKNVEVENLTEEELTAKFSEATQEEMLSWIKMFCEVLRRVDPLLKELERDGIIQSISKEEYEQQQQAEE